MSTKANTRTGVTLAAAVSFFDAELYGGWVALPRWVLLLQIVVEPANS